MKIYGDRETLIVRLELWPGRRTMVEAEKSRTWMSPPFMIYLSAEKPRARKNVLQSTFQRFILLLFSMSFFLYTRSEKKQQQHLMQRNNKHNINLHKFIHNRWSWFFVWRGRKKSLHKDPRTSNFANNANSNLAIFMVSFLRLLPKKCFSARTHKNDQCDRVL